MIKAKKRTEKTFQRDVGEEVLEQIKKFSKKGQGRIIKIFKNTYLSGEDVELEKLKKSLKRMSDSVSDYFKKL